MPLTYPLLLAALLFGAGVYAVLARRSAVLVLVGLELMLNAAMLNLVAVDRAVGDRLHSGQSLTLLVIGLAAAEVALGLALVRALVRGSGTAAVDRLAEDDVR